MSVATLVCPVCGVPGARVLLHLVHCVHRRCRYYDASERAWLELHHKGDALKFNRYPILLIKAHLAALNDDLGTSLQPAW